MAQALLDRETIDRDEVQLLAEGKNLPPLAPEPASVEPTPVVPDEKPRETSERGPVLGTPGAEPAGA